MFFQSTVRVGICFVSDAGCIIIAIIFIIFIIFIFEVGWMDMVCSHEARTRPPAAYRHYDDNDDDDEELSGLRSPSLPSRHLALWPSRCP